jgi:predicted choloylglycine hydrolase
MHVFPHPPVFTQRIAHVCYHLVRDSFPYSAPAFHALIDHLHDLKALGYTGICLEGEAMFPYASARHLQTELTWTPEQIKQLNETCETLELELIPLLQCLGHNYLLLSDPRHAHIRELPGHIQQVCPSNPESRTTYLQLVDDVCSLFPNVKRIHIGGDECRVMGQCPVCKKTVQQHDISTLYTTYVSQIIQALLTRGITPVLWSDMLEHHPQAMDAIPKQTELVYWNYDLKDWGRPFFVEPFLEKGYKVIGAPAIRWGQLVTDLTPPYRVSLKGIRDLIQTLASKSVREMLITDWTKGTHYALSDYGWFYAAALMHQPDMEEEQIQRAYDMFRFGTDKTSLATVYATLAVFLPLFETPQYHWRNRLNRYDLNHYQFEIKRKQYSQPDAIQKTEQQIHTATTEANRALERLWHAKPHIQKGMDYWYLLEEAARTLLTRAAIAREVLLTDDPNPGTEEALFKAARLEGIRNQISARKKRMYSLYSQKNPPQIVDHLLSFRFPPDETAFLHTASERYTQSQPFHNANPVVLPYFYNPGPPMERGLEHGRVFREQIRQGLTWYSEEKNTIQYLQARDAMEQYLFKSFPWIIDELKGIANGAGVSYESILWLNVFNAVTSVPSTHSCSMVVQHCNSDAAMLKTSDIDRHQRSMMMIQHLDYKGMRLLTIGWVGTVWTEVGINSRGFAVGCNSAPANSNQTGYGIPQHIGCYPLLWEAESIGEAKAFFDAYPFAGKGLNIGCLDASNQGVLVECAGPDHAYIEQQNNSFVATNHYTHQTLSSLNKQLSTERQYESEQRYQRLVHGLQSHSEMDLIDSLKQVAAQNEGDGAICKQTEPVPETGITLAAAILHPSNKQLVVTGTAPDQNRWYRIGV